MGTYGAEGAASPEWELSRQLRRQRQAFSSPACLSPADSGYGSAFSSPKTPQGLDNPDRQTLGGLWMLGDGNLSDLDDPFTNSEDEKPAAARPELVTQAAEIGLAQGTGERPKHSTLPTRSFRSRPALPASFHSDSGAAGLPRQGSDRGLVRGTGSLRLPDRFIPTRTHSANTAEKFRTGKAPHELTPSEKLLRHNGATEDAFCYRRRAVTPMACDFRSRSHSDTTESQRQVGSVLSLLDQNGKTGLDRQASNGTIWAVGGVIPGGAAVNNGRGQLVRSGTNARLFRTSFPNAKPQAEEEREKHESRLAAALGLDRVKRILEVNITHKQDHTFGNKHGDVAPTQWNGTEWVKNGPLPRPLKPQENRLLPIAPFKVLDAPNLRDDFYCSILAYSITCRTLAVGLGDLLYGWSESRGVQLLNAGTQEDCHLTSVAFSSSEGRKSILAFGRSNKTLGLMSLNDDAEPASSRSGPMPRFEVLQPAPVACLSWKPTCTIRPSKSSIHPGHLVKTEDLLVGDETGHVYYYAVEWPERWEVERHNWAGQMTLLARITIHAQQICGLSWSPNGALFATGGNDNQCCLFETGKAIVAHSQAHDSSPGRDDIDNPTRSPSRETSEASTADTEIRVQNSRTAPTIVKHLRSGDEKYRWLHGAAVKAIAFCPWQDGLVATGGGSNDKCIHFFHTTSGAALATISVSAQVTSLIWSTTRREIAATFGYAQPEHPVRIAVFSWPDCRQVAAIPWMGEHRALYAIPYPGGPKNARSPKIGNRARSYSRPAMEGCIMVASSDKSVKFHEVWAADKKAIAGGVGMLGGSDILESLEGIDKEGDVIR
ncbi:WD40 repeat-like protein [Lasiosphaeria miniovina]|uniref:WD40 repeat-like protein n=1 Tax=Lasiosphaeria miniovina TaxID=1954250 RepID=A0AA40A457_9PEZI|nr:WD40 repeat-like protein [Lasiosphaeria miniovina]KAK0708947.1 WD40 repeat-like protein [Lasiosphaeria miniovina]